MIYSDLSTWPAFGGEKASVVLQPGLFFLRIFPKKIKKQSTTKVYISPYITRAGASVLDKKFDKWLAAYER